VVSDIAFDVVKPNSLFKRQGPRRCRATRQNQCEKNCACRRNQPCHLLPRSRRKLLADSVQQVRKWVRSVWPRRSAAGVVARFVTRGSHRADRHQATSGASLPLRNQVPRRLLFPGGNARAGMEMGGADFGNWGHCDGGILSQTCRVWSGNFYCRSSEGGWVLTRKACAAAMVRQPSGCSDGVRSKQAIQTSPLTAVPAPRAIPT